jgi:hypothetical protein
MFFHLAVTGLLRYASQSGSLRRRTSYTDWSHRRRILVNLRLVVKCGATNWFVYWTGDTQRSIYLYPYSWESEASVIDDQISETILIGQRKLLTCATSYIFINYGLDDRGVGVRVPIGSRIFFSPNRPDRLWGPPNLSIGYRGLFPWG